MTPNVALPPAARLAVLNAIAPGMNPAPVPVPSDSTVVTLLMEDETLLELPELLEVLELLEPPRPIMRPRVVESDEPLQPATNILMTTPTISFFMINLCYGWPEASLALRHTLPVTTLVKPPGKAIGPDLLTMYWQFHENF